VALVRYHFHKSPADLTEDEFVNLATEALFIEDFHRQQMEVAMEKSLLTQLKILYPPKQ
jgi:hypothetical protein